MVFYENDLLYKENTEQQNEVPIPIIESFEEAKNEEPPEETTEDKDNDINTDT